MVRAWPSVISMSFPCLSVGNPKSAQGALKVCWGEVCPAGSEGTATVGSGEAEERSDAVISSRVALGLLVCLGCGFRIPKKDDMDLAA